MALKTEAIGLATMVELPLVIVDIQRGGPSTGLPTKTEQADLFQALFGRNSEAPVPVLAASSPGDCFWVALEASRIAIKYMVPVIVLSDGYLANGAEPWRVPSVEEIPEIPVRFRTDPAGFRPYEREPHTLSRPWVVPGTPGLEHRVGGLEKQDGGGNISYDAAQPRDDGPPARGQGRGGRPGRPRRGAGGRPRRRPADRGLGLDLRRHHRGAARPAREGPAHRPRAPAAPQPAARGTSARC